MTRSRAGVGAAVLALSGLAVLGLQAPASAAANPDGAPANNPQCPSSEHYVSYAPHPGCYNNGLIVSRRTVHPGTSETVTTWGFKTGTSVRFAYDGQTVGTGTMGRRSWAQTTFTIPGGSQAGSHTVAAFGTAWNGQASSLSVKVRVVGANAAPKAEAGTTPPVAPVTAPTTNLNATNASAQTSRSMSSTELAGLAGAGILLMGAGPSAVYVGRRRRARP